MDLNNSSLYIYIAAFISLLFSIMIGRFLYKSNIPSSLLDMPDIRKVHTTPTPLIGGITILFSSLITFLMFNLFQDAKSVFYIVFAIYFFLIGLFDDIFIWNFKNKLILQILGIVLFLSTLNLNINQIIFSNIILDLNYGNYVIIGLWMLIIINAFNFFDGINFLAGSLSLAIFSSYAIFYNISNGTVPLILMVILIFSILGFLIYNRAPAKMFLGDAGSLFLGFTIAAFPIIFSKDITNSLDLTFPIIATFILVSDTLYVIFNRIKTRKNPFFPDKTHLHHQLLNLKFHNRYIVTIIFFGSFLHSLLAFNSNDLTVISIVLYLIIINIIFIILPRFLPRLFAKYNLWGIKIFYDKMVNFFQKNN